MALSLIDGERTWAHIIQGLSLLTEQAPEKAAKFLNDTIQSVDPSGEIVLEDERPCLNIYDPSDFIIPPGKLDLKSRLEAPLLLLLKITSRCNTNCIYCYSSRNRIKPERELPLVKYKEILHEAKDIGVAQVNLCGGDGFVRHDFTDIIHQCMQFGFTTDVSTKTALTQDQTERLVESGLDYLQVSIDSCNPAVANRLFRRKGHYEKLITSIKRLKASGVYVRTNSVITSLNLATVEGTIAMLADLGIDNIKITPAFKSYHVDNTKYLLSPDEIRSLEALVNELSFAWAKKGVRVFYSYLKPPDQMDEKEKADYWFKFRAMCSGGRSALFVTPDGKVTLCEQVPHKPPFIVGDLTKQSVKGVWDSQEVLDMAYPNRERFVGTACFECLKFDHCTQVMGHCFRDSWFDSGGTTLFGPSPYCPRKSTGTGTSKRDILLDIWTEFGGRS